MAPARWTLATAVSAALLAPAAASCAPAERAQARAEQKTVEQAPPVSQPPRRSPADAIAIPAGSFALGSIPGSSGRDPALEADLVALQLPAFEIDRLPYPNDSTKPFRTAIDRDEATALCAQRGKRLCSEQEWERACKATNDALYPTGSRLDLTACKRDPAACATSEGVLALGTSQREWTLSTAASGLGDPSHSAVVRGASVDAAPAQHRCAARAGVAPDTRSADLGFRCCRGGDGDGAIAAYPTEPARELTRGLNLERDALRAALAAVPALGKLAPSFEPFSDADVSAALRRGGQSRDSLRLWTFMPSAFAWSPGPGEELWVLTGRTRDGALLALLYPLGGGRFVHAASTLIAEPDATLAIGASAQYPNQLTWTTCYACAGEGGTIRLRDDARVELVYR